MKKKIFALAILTLALVGCGPVYRTDYTYIAPKSPAGKACTFQCETSRLQCNQIEDMNKDRCVSEARHDYYRCRHDHEGDKHHYCFERTCEANYDRCDAMYRSCFQACGGTVNSRQVCTMFCDK